MKKLALISLALFLILGCGNDKTTGPQGISVSVFPSRGIVDFDSTFHFNVTVNGTSNQSVTWIANEVVGGDSAHGYIDSQGNYTAPSTTPNGVDSVRIAARSVEDTAKTGIAYAILVDPNVIYVQMSGSDSTGVGSERRPYRTITKALTRARSGQIVIIGAGEFNVAAGEVFPLHIGSGITIRGAGGDSTYVTGPGGMNPETDAMFQPEGDAITIERLHIRSSNSLGVGIWLRPGFQTRLTRNYITNTYIGIYASGAAAPRPIIDANRFTADSIGIVCSDSSRPLVRNSFFSGCPKYGIDIRDFSAPDLGVNDSTGAGHDTIQDCGNNLYQWLIYNGSPNPVWAVGNVWQVPLPENNDQFIYDDEESGGASGQVILTEQ